MFESKFKIGDVVCAKNSHIDKAVVIGVRVRYSSLEFLSNNKILSIDEYLNNTNCCDYEILYNYSGNDCKFEWFPDICIEKYNGE